VDKSFLIEQIGQIDNSVMLLIDEGLRLVLAL